MWWRFSAIYLLFIFLPSSIIHAATIGSKAAVTWIASQQIVRTGDLIDGFTLLKDGFYLQSIVTTATYNAVFPVSGTIELSGGTLILQNSLSLAEDADILSSGNIVGNGYAINFATTTTALMGGSGPIGFDLTKILTQVVRTNVTAVAWSYDSKYLAVGLSAGAGDEIRIYEFDGTTLTLRAGIPVSVAVNDISWHPSSYTFAYVRNAALLTNNLLIHSFTPPSTIGTIDGITFLGDQQSVEWSPNGAALAVAGADTLTTLVRVYTVNPDFTLNQITIPSFTLLTNLTSGAPVVSWNASSTYLAVGLAAAALASELRVLSYSPPPVSLLTQNAQLEIGQNVTSVDWNPYYNPTILAVKYAGSGPRLYNHDAGAGTLTLVHTNTGQPSSVGALSWAPDGRCLAYGRNGADGNSLLVYRYDKALQTLDLTDSFNGSINHGDLMWAPSNDVLATAETNLGNAGLYSRSLSLLNGFTWSDVTMVLENNLVLQDCSIIFKGNSTILGNGNIIELLPTGSIIIAANTTLSLDNVVLSGVTPTNLILTDSTSILEMSDTVLIMEASFLMDKGSFSILGGDMELRGKDHFFTYASNQVSTAAPYSRLVIDNG